ncbi:MAG: hypothetical protein Q8940_02170 [Bacteroidota bacterium]|nr:hypothetical protein [Bacteroidota bacterium]
MKKYIYNFTLILSVLCIVAYFTKWNTQGQKTYKAGELNKLLADGNEEKEHAKPGYPGEMLSWYIEQRGKMPVQWRQTALNHIQLHNIRLNKSANIFNWTQLGPGNIGGRIRSIAVDPVNG